MGAVMATLNTCIGHIRADETLLGARPDQAPSQALSDPEARILLLIAAGKQNAEIAAAVGMDQPAVKEHIKSILRKAIAAGGRKNSPGGTDLCSSEFVPEMISPFIS
jgi:DNA-binding CsgD family transcriptional regulator